MDRQIGVISVAFKLGQKASHQILFPLPKSFPSERKQAEAFYIMLIKWNSF